MKEHEFGNLFLVGIASKLVVVTIFNALDFYMRCSSIKTDILKQHSQRVPDAIFLYRVWDMNSIAQQDV